MSRTVLCVKLGLELPGLDFLPAAGELGERILNQVSAQAWEMWREYRVILINRYQLSLTDPSSLAFLRQQMEEFFFE